LEGQDNVSEDESLVAFKSELSDWYWQMSWEMFNINGGHKQYNDLTKTRMHFIDNQNPQIIKFSKNLKPGKKAERCSSFEDTYSDYLEVTCGNSQTTHVPNVGYIINYSLDDKMDRSLPLLSELWGNRQGLLLPRKLIG
jgi:hypothetical protein